MQPVADVREQLFLAAGVPRDHITEFGCGHVIPPHNLLPLILTRGPTGLDGLQLPDERSDNYDR